MHTKTTPTQAPTLAPEKMAAVSAAMQTWLTGHTAHGGFATAWANASSPVGGGLVNVDSAEEWDIVMFG